jgi:hypothetical protein
MTADIDVGRLVMISAKLESVEDAVTAIRKDLEILIEKERAKATAPITAPDVTECCECGKSFERSELRSCPNCLMLRCQSCTKSHACSGVERRVEL